MNSHAKVVVIGGGVVGCSVLYHLARAGWTDIVLLERDELTSGSTWHAAGGMHTINGDPNVAKLQKYTIELYKEIEELSGQATGVHITGGVLLAATEARMDWLRGVVAKGRYLGIELEEISAAEAAELMPLPLKRTVAREPASIARRAPPPRCAARALECHSPLQVMAGCPSSMLPVATPPDGGGGGGGAGSSGGGGGGGVGDGGGGSLGVEPATAMR